MRFAAQQPKKKEVVEHEPISLDLSSLYFNQIIAYEAGLHVIDCAMDRIQQQFFNKNKHPYIEEKIMDHIKKYILISHTAKDKIHKIDYEDEELPQTVNENYISNSIQMVTRSVKLSYHMPKNETSLSNEDIHAEKQDVFSKFYLNKNIETYEIKENSGFDKYSDDTEIRSFYTKHDEKDEKRVSEKQIPKNLEKKEHFTYDYDGSKLLVKKTVPSKEPQVTYKYLPESDKAKHQEPHKEDNVKRKNLPRKDTFLDKLLKKTNSGQEFAHIQPQEIFQKFSAKKGISIVSKEHNINIENVNESIVNKTNYYKSIQKDSLYYNQKTPIHQEISSQDQTNASEHPPKTNNYFMRKSASSQVMKQRQTQSRIILHQSNNESQKTLFSNQPIKSGKPSRDFSRTSSSKTVKSQKSLQTPYNQQNNTYLLVDNYGQKNQNLSKLKAKILIQMNRSDEYNLKILQNHAWGNDEKSQQNRTQMCLPKKFRIKG